MATGRFQVDFETSGEYELTAQAVGYEPFTLSIPNIDEIEGKEARLPLKKMVNDLAELAPLTRSRILQDGHPIQDAAVTVLGRARREMNKINAQIQRGVQIPIGGIPLGTTRTNQEGRFEVGRIPGLPKDVAKRGLYFSIDDGRGHQTILGPLESKNGISIVGDFSVTRPQGKIKGHIQGFPDSARGRCFVVAFDRACYLNECLVSHDGSFAFDALNSGQYALRVATGVLAANERGDSNNSQDVEQEADPWSYAIVIEVPSEDAAAVMLEYPSEPGTN